MTVIKVIRDSARHEMCTARIPGVCSCNRDTTVFAHAPSPYKGLALKSPDWWGAYLCYECHWHLDNNKATQEEANEAWLRGICLTQYKLFEKGLIGVQV